MTMNDILLYGGSLALVLLVVWGARRYYYSKPRGFTGHDGRKWTWHPGGSFSDADGRPVTDAETAALCRQAWDELHRRTAQQTAAIQSIGFPGRD
jgi:YD repeat-containing protein